MQCQFRIWVFQEGGWLGGVGTLTVTSDPRGAIPNTLSQTHKDTI